MFSEYRTLFPFLARHRATYGLGLACVGLAVSLRLSVPWLLGDSFDTILALPEDERAPAVLKRALLIVGVSLLGAAIRTTSRITVLGTARRVAHDLRVAVFEHLMRLAPSFYVRNPTGQVLSRCINDMQNVQGLTGPVILYLVETLLLFVVCIALMLGVSPLLTLLGLLPYPPFLWVARRLARRIQEGSRAAQNSLAEVAAKVDESLSGQLVVKTLALEEADSARFRAHCEEYRRLNLRVTRDRALLIPLMMGLTALGTLIVLGVGGPRVARGEMTLGELVTFVLFLTLLASPTRTLGFVISSLRRGASALGRIQEILESELALVDGARAGEARVEGGALEVHSLSVVYPPIAEQPHLTGSRPALDGAADRERRVLDDVSFSVPAGRTLGIVGHTGSGKTTLIKALARQLEVEPGTVYLDGQDVTELGLEEVRSQIGVVPQDAFLFSRTLAENIALGAPEAERSAIERALVDAQLANDLDQLPDGLETVVGERGVNLSGGQRQRAALARVLLLEPKVLLIDDTLSAVDTQTAEAILDALRPFASKRSTVIVSHRLSTLMHADEILVLDEGRVAERGTHAELLRREGAYASLWERQERSDAREQRSRALEDELGLEHEGGH